MQRPIVSYEGSFYDVNARTSDTLEENTRMNVNRTEQNKTEHEIIAALERLSQENGFIYTFCSMVINFLWMSPDEAADIDWHRRPNIGELSFLLGLMIKRPLRLTEPPSEKEANRQISAAIGLLDELHYACGFSLVPPTIEAEQDIETWTAEYAQSYEDWMQGGQGMVEPIFYGGGGAFDFQYLEMAERRYRNDKKWLGDYLGASFESFLEIAKYLKQLSSVRANNIRNESTFEELCLQWIEVFSFSPEDIPGLPKGTIDSFLRIFSLTSGEANQGFDTIGAYNEAHSHPVIRLEQDRYFLPIFFNLAESIYESPYYWMLGDSSYEETGLQNRGDATEQIAYELLAQAFGENNAYRGVKIRKGKSDVTDIDVLAFKGNKAVIVQAKSKKLTMASRRGEEECLKRDFQNAIQDAYDQALVSQKALLEAGNSLTVDGRPITQVVGVIDEVYIVCLTGDHYPAATTQLETYLRKKGSDPFPVAMSIFDLDIVTFYLRDPYELLYYFRQRSNHATLFMSDSEMGFLAFHLRSKLFPMEDADYIYIPQDIAQLIDAHFPVAKENWPDTDAANRLFSEWRNEAFTKLVHEVKMSGHHEIADVVFLLYDWAGPGADNFIMIFDKVRHDTLRDGKFHDAAVSSSRYKRGITFVSYPKTSSYTEEQSFQEKFRALAIAQKYKSRSDEWLGLASREGSLKAVDAVWYSKEPWQPDPTLDNVVVPLMDPRKAVNADGRRVGRNEPCPCGSGLKFKKCHGR